MFKQALRRPRKINLKWMIVFLLIFSVISIFWAIGLGPVSVPVKVVFNVIVSKFPLFFSGTNQEWTELDEHIIWHLRFPRVLLGLIVGASLAVAGVAMQALIRNPLADPFILGVSSGASAMATLGMLFGTFHFLGTYSLSISAFLGAAVTIVIVFFLSKVSGRINITHLLLIGVVVAMIMDAITRIITLHAPNALGIHNATFWLSGSLAGAKWGYLQLPAIVIIICITILMLHYRSLNALIFGEETAITLGMKVGYIQHLLIIIASLLAGITISVSGAIGFVGLMAPHIARLLVGSDHKKVLPISALLGGILVIWTDVAARMILAPEELPIGLLTAIFGGPFFIFLLKKKSKFV